MMVSDTGRKKKKEIGCEADLCVSCATDWSTVKRAWQVRLYFLPLHISILTSLFRGVRSSSKPDNLPTLLEMRG